MPDSGFNPLAILAPDLYAQQLAIQRRQALAQSLLQQGEGNSGSAAYGGLANAGKSLLGAFLAKRGDQAMANLYSPQPDASQATSQAPSEASGQVSNASMPSAPQDATPPSGVPQGQSPQIGNTPGPTPIQQQAPNVAMGQALQGKRSIPSVMNGAIADLPGMSHQQSMLAYFQSPQAYYTALAQSHALTDQQKNINAAYGQGTPEAQAMLTGTLQKGAMNTLRPGNMSQNLATGQMTGIPNNQGITPIQMPNGQIGMQMAPGAAQAIQQSSYASGMGAAGAKPATGYDPSTNMPVATNAAVMAAGGGQPSSQGLNINANNPLNVQSGGRDIPYSTPTAGLGKAWETLGHYGQQGINTVQKIVSTWAPDAPPQYAASVAQALKVDPNQPLNMADPNIKGQLIDAMRPNETGNKYARPNGGAMLPELPQGQATYMQGQAHDAADRHDAVVAAAAESPMRINVLDNIIKLSQSGVGTGPGAEFQNNIKGYLANTPGLGKLFTGTQTNVGNFQELQKFMYQNALRNWQAAGGTGTDSQLESAAKANPNDHLFPQALQTIAKWGKASELAVQGKANAQDAFLAQNGQTPTNQIKFESTWRNAFDPKVFQYSQMTPQEKQTFAQQDLKTPQAAKAFIAKQQALKQLGALQ